jgi:hypothetical protein
LYTPYLRANKTCCINVVESFTAVYSPRICAQQRRRSAHRKQEWVSGQGNHDYVGGAKPRVQQRGYGIESKETNPGLAHRRHNEQRVPRPAVAKCACRDTSASLSKGSRAGKWQNLCIYMKMQPLKTSFSHSAARTATIGLNGREPGRLLA